MASSMANGPGQTGLIEVIRRAGRTTRRAIAEHTGLSRSAVAQTVAELIARGIVVERPGSEPSPTARAGRGRPTTVLELAPLRGAVLACDIGHRHLAVATCDLRGRVLAEERVEFRVDDGAAPTMRALQRLTADSLRRAGVDAGEVRAVGVAFPFPVLKADGGVHAPAALAGWQGVTAEAARPPGVRAPLVADNDANFGAWGEHVHAGAARGDLLYVKLSDGIGAGVIVDGALLSGSRGTGGEMGHIQVDPDGALCRCGRRGCLETVIAATLPDEHLAGRHAGRAIAQLSAFVDAETVVLGGRLGAAGGRFADGVREAMARFSPHTGPRVEVRVAALGARSELVGIIDRALTAAWASGTVASRQDGLSSWPRTNSRAVLERPFDAERVS